MNFTKIYEEELSKTKSMIDSIRKLVVDVSVYEEKYEEFNSHCSSNFLDEIKCFRSDLQEEYSIPIRIQETFEYFKNQVDNNVLYNINNIIISLESVVVDGLLADDRFTNLIYYVYKVSYEFMKKELLFLNSNNVFLYFKKSKYDEWYINEFVKADILELENSLNTVLGINELMVKVNECRCDENDNFMNEDLLKLLAVCSYPNEAREFYLDKVIMYIEELQSVLNRLNDIFDGVRKASFSSIQIVNDSKLNEEVENLKNNYLFYKESVLWIFSIFKCDKGLREEFNKVINDIYVYVSEFDSRKAKINSFKVLRKKMI